MLDQIASFIQGHDRFVISTHVSPEADALGSALALYWGLRQLKKQAIVVMRDPVPKNLDFLLGVSEILSPKALHDEDFEQVIVVDCGHPKRVGKELFERFKGHFLINIDHHCDNPRFGNLHYVRELASATMVVDELFKVLDVRLDATLSTCLYAGLMADTNAFRNANVDAAALDSATRWVEAGTNPHQVAQNMFERQSWREMQLLAYALSATQLDDKMIWCSIPQSAFEQFDVHPNDTDGIIVQLRAVEGIDIAILFKEIDKDKVKISLRAKGDVPVNQIAQHFGGGGHVKAAGCFVEGPLDQVAEIVLTHIRKHFLSVGQPI